MKQRKDINIEVVPNSGPNLGSDIGFFHCVLREFGSGKCTLLSHKNDTCPSEKEKKSPILPGFIDSYTIYSVPKNCPLRSGNVVISLKKE